VVLQEDWEKKRTVQKGGEKQRGGGSISCPKERVVERGKRGKGRGEKSMPPSPRCSHVEKTAWKKKKTGRCVCSGCRGR